MEILHIQVLMKHSLLLHKAKKMRPWRTYPLKIDLMCMSLLGTRYLLSFSYTCCNFLFLMALLLENFPIAVDCYKLSLWRKKDSQASKHNAPKLNACLKHLGGWLKCSPIYWIWVLSTRKFPIHPEGELSLGVLWRCLQHNSNFSTARGAKIRL